MRCFLRSLLSSPPFLLFLIHQEAESTYNINDQCPPALPSLPPLLAPASPRPISQPTTFPFSFPTSDPASSSYPNAALFSQPALPATITSSMVPPRSLPVPPAPPSLPISIPTPSPPPRVDIYQLALRQQQVYQQQNQKQHQQLVEGGLGGGREGGMAAVQVSVEEASDLEPKAMAMEGE